MQFNNDEYMEWEDIIETDNIIEKVTYKISFTIFLICLI